MYLLDTHAFIWFLNDDDKLPVDVKDIIMRSEHLYISQAITEKLTLISADSKFSAYEVRLLWG